MGKTRKRLQTLRQFKWVVFIELEQVLTQLAVTKVEITK